MQKLGTFEVTSGKLQVTDPCYSKDTWCAGTLKKVRNGTWVGYVVRCDETGQKPFPEGIRNAELLACHADVVMPKRWTKTEIDVGVDSGQAGIFDAVKYPAKGSDDDDFYNAACNCTIEPDEYPRKYDPNFKCAGVVKDFGVVSRSGYGDGSYDCYVARRKDQIVAVRIVFIPKKERGPEIKFDAVIAKPLPDKSEIQYGLEESLLRLSELNDMLGNSLSYDLRKKIEEVKSMPKTKFQMDTEEVIAWNKANATYFPTWITREEMNKRMAEYRAEKGYK